MVSLITGPFGRPVPHARSCLLRHQASRSSHVNKATTKQKHPEHIHNLGRVSWKHFAHTRTSDTVSWQLPFKQCIASLLCSAAFLLPSVCFAEPFLTNKPVLSTDYDTVVRKREGRAKSNLPSAKEAEALLEINEELFTAEALEGMSRQAPSPVWSNTALQCCTQAFCFTGLYTMLALLRGSKMLKRHLDVSIVQTTAC